MLGIILLGWGCGIGWDGRLESGFACLVAQSMASDQLGRSPRRQVEGTRLTSGGESWATDGVWWQKRHGSNQAGLGATAIESN